MKSLFFTSIFLLFTFSFSLAQQKPSTVSPVSNTTDKDTPDIVFEKDTHDFGTIPNGGDGICEFEFKNIGKNPLVLSNVKASCGCTTPEWSTEPIKKGKTGIIKVKYDTKRIGSFTKTITVYSNAKNPQVRLTIKGTVEAPAGGTAPGTTTPNKIEPSDK